MYAQIAYVTALVASFVWFSMAYHYFVFRQRSAANILVPESARDSPLYSTIAAAGRFLGGMNAALALLCAALTVLALSGSQMFVGSNERAVLLFVIAAAHFSQFYFNVPVLLNGERRGEAYWPVLSGPMRTIFVVDAIETLLCLFAGVLQLL